VDSPEVPLISNPGTRPCSPRGLCVPHLRPRQFERPNYAVPYHTGIIINWSRPPYSPDISYLVESKDATNFKTAEPAPTRHHPEQAHPFCQVRSQPACSELRRANHRNASNQAMLLGQLVGQCSPVVLEELRQHMVPKSLKQDISVTGLLVVLRGLSSPSNTLTHLHWTTVDLLQRLTLCHKQPFSFQVGGTGCCPAVVIVLPYHAHS
jgi:hypothetical protein